MRSIARLSAALLLSVSVVACGGDDEEPTAIPGGGGPDSSMGGTPDAGASGDPDSGQQAARDAGRDAQQNGNADTGPVLDLPLPMANVDCNGNPCNTLDNVCCESWSKTTGFSGNLSCITMAECNKKFARSGEQNRSVVHECDDKQDCSAGQVCCFYAYSQPLCELGDILECTTKLIGPGGSRVCADNDACELGSTQYIGDGAAIGVLSCLADSDCEDRPGTTCQPEESGSLTTGKSGKARSYVKVCR
jgi:hypothetical protein